MEDDEIIKRLTTAKLQYGSLRKLAPHVGLKYRSLSRYLLKSRSPSKTAREKLERFLSAFSPSSIAYKRRFAKKIESPAFDPELAELVGILFGDGEVKSTGEMRLSFDTKKDRYFINDRTIPLILQKINPNKISFESYKRIWFQKSSFVNWIISTGFPSGSRPINDAKIPAWCFSNERFLISFIRGLFDTDGIFNFLNHNVEIMFGRFSAKYTYFPRQLADALLSLGIHASLQKSKDGRFKIRITGKMNILLFFALIGSSNLKHIIRFLLWRVDDRVVKIDAQPIEQLFSQFRSMTGIAVPDIDLPFVWNSSNPLFYDWIYEDSKFLFTEHLRHKVNGQVLTKLLLSYYPLTYLASILKVRGRSIKRWVAGLRGISSEHFYQLLDALFKIPACKMGEELLYGKIN
ncbi:MAG: LAGLIDADG family homing endonuclease, partial [Candidatus Micrarchaeota archaeon]|nr:LAGLIDADG family homing endonuclease [Candidatus Micrarchaeota archaeon]